jgi:hypothetical protein
LFVHFHDRDEKFKCQDTQRGVSIKCISEILVLFANIFTAFGYNKRSLSERITCSLPIYIGFYWIPNSWLLFPSERNYKQYKFFKSTTFWDIMSCSPLRVNRSLGETYRLHLQGRKISQARNHRESRWAACHLLSCWLLAWFIFWPWRWRRYVTPKRRLTLNGLHDVISQKTVVFITTAVRTSIPTHTNFWFDKCQWWPITITIQSFIK